MNYLKARQRQSDQRWDYTCQNDGRVWPIGYCSGWREYGPEERNALLMNDQFYAEYTSRKDKYHANGHATEQEACECYKQHQLDAALRFHDQTSRQEKCVVCEAWTTKRAVIGGWESYVLCEKHANREEVSKIYNVFESSES